MALFGPKKKDIFSEPTQKETPKEEPIKQETKPAAPVDNSKVKMPTNSALITKCMNTNGNMSGCGSIIIEGNHTGEISMEDTVIVSGAVDGKIEAKNIKVSGEMKGVLVCDTLEITKDAKVDGKMYALKSFINGTVEGEIYSDETIEVDANGRLTLQECRSQTIKVLGKLSGRVVASQMLEVIRGGSIEGEIVTKGIKTLDGGSVVGTIVTYDEKIHSAKPENAPSRATKVEEPKEDDSKRELKEDVAELINVDDIDVNKYAPKKEG
jgi:cytoskeletal protein CcmA (bactofilin family)